MVLVLAVLAVQQLGGDDHRCRPGEHLDLEGEHGEVAVFEYDDLEDTQAFADLEGEAGGLFGEDDAALLAEALQPESSAVIILWEDLWAKPFAEAVAASGGFMARGERVPAEEVAQLLASLEEAS